MSILRPVSILLRNFLIKQHPYFSCCASCGEIKTPLEGRLCTSLLPEFTVDAVIVPHSTGKAGAADASIASALSVRQSAPWLRRIFVMEKNAPGKTAPAAPPYTRAEAGEGIVLCDPDTLRCSEGFAGVEESVLRALPVEALLHAVPGIAGYYLVVHAPASAELRSPLDYFTPNGIPLIHVRWVPEETVACVGAEEALALMRGEMTGTRELSWPPLPHAYPQSVECSASFLPHFADMAGRRLGAFPDAAIERADYVFMLARWMFSTRQGILSPLEGRGVPGPSFSQVNAAC